MSPKTNNKKVILFLNENPLPHVFTKGTISGKELRLRSAISEIDQIHVVSRRGREVTSKNDQVGLLEKKIQIHLLPKWPYYFATIPLFFVGFYWAIKLKPVLIEAESPIISGPAAILIGKILGIPTNIEVRSYFQDLLTHRFKFIPLTLKSFLFNLTQNFSLNHTQLVTFNSTYLQKKYPLQSVNTAVINPGVQYPPKKISIKSSPPITIGFLGRLVPEKGVNILIDAIPMIRNQDIQFEIAGDGPELTNLTKKVEVLGLKSKVKFLGMMHNFTALKRWNILVNPILVNPPLEMVNAEAAYMGIPVICFGSSKIPETVIHMQTGIKVKSKTAINLSQAIDKLSSNPKLMHKLSTQSQQFAKQNYSFDSQVDKLRKSYQLLQLF